MNTPARSVDLGPLTPNPSPPKRGRGEQEPHLLHVTRRTFLRDGIGSVALASLLASDGAADPTRRDPLAPRKPPQPAKANAVIVLHLSGAPPHLDLFDYKPELVKRNDQPIPESFVKGKRFAFTTGIPKLLGTPHRFRQHGQGGAWVSDVLPGIASCADDLCFLKAMWTEQFNHAPA